MLKLLVVSLLVLFFDFVKFYHMPCGFKLIIKKLLLKWRKEREKHQTNARKVSQSAFLL